MELFNTDIAGSQTITFNSGVVSKAIGSIASITDNSISGGLYSGGVDNNSTGGFLEIDWTFPSPIFAFGADFSSTAQGNGVLIIIGNFDGFGQITINPGVELGGDGTGFLGLIGSSSFDFLRLDNTHPTNNERFTVDNLAFAESVSAVPAPDTFWLFSSGLIGLIIIKGSYKGVSQLEKIKNGLEI